MASSPPPTYNIIGHKLLFLSNDEETPAPYPTPMLIRPVARRTPSYSSSPFSFNEEYNSNLKFKGSVPFSWEEIPGIPKNQQQYSKKKEYSGRHLLPLPPAGDINSSAKNKDVISPNKYNNSTRFQQKDPFLAALVECSRDEYGTNFGNNYLKGSISCNSSKSNNKVSRGVLSTDRLFGFINIMYTTTSSCKIRTSCAVSQSIVYLPRPRPRPHYDPLLNRRRPN